MRNINYFLVVSIIGSCLYGAPKQSQDLKKTKSELLSEFQEYDGRIKRCQSDRFYLKWQMAESFINSTGYGLGVYFLSDRCLVVVPSFCMILYLLSLRIDVKRYIQIDQNEKTVIQQCAQHFGKQKLKCIKRTLFKKNSSTALIDQILNAREKYNQERKRKDPIMAVAALAFESKNPNCRLAACIVQMMGK